MKKLSFVKSVLMAASLMTVAMTAFAADEIRERSFKFATQNPKGHPIVLGAEKFAEAVTARSGGKMKVQVFPGGVLGNDQANVSAVQGGTLDFVSLNSGILASQVKEFAIFDFPFLFATAQEADAVVDGHVGKRIHSLLEPKGIVGLGFFELGFRNITNSKRPINKVEDLDGLKLRVIPNAINVDWVKALNANPTPLPFPEVYGALEQKAIDGQENPFTVILANKLNEVQKHLAVTNHQYNPQSVIVSKKVWDTLNAKEREVIQGAFGAAQSVQRGSSRVQANTALEGLKKSGMQVTELSAAELTKFQEKMKPVIAKHGALVGEATVNEMQAALAQLRGGAKPAKK